MYRTVNELENEIRSATTLQQLKRLVGPSQAEISEADKRAKQIAEIEAEHIGVRLWPDKVFLEYHKLKKEQKRYLTDYFS